MPALQDGLVPRAGRPNEGSSHSSVVSLHLATGRTVSFEVTTGLTGPGYFVLSVRKCGSSVFNKVCKALANHNSRRFVDVANAFFSANIPMKDYIGDPALKRLIFGGNVYGGFRSMPVAFRGNELFEEGLKVLMIRDPRDALVSQYFSAAYSHPMPESQSGDSGVRQLMETRRAYALRTEIDDYVRRNARNMARTMVEYRDILDTSCCTVLKYEDYVFEKPSLIRLVAQAFGWKADDQLIQRILIWADERPEKEDPRAFVRKVTPGDHREKLKRETISAINETLRPAMEIFGYS